MKVSDDTHPTLDDEGTVLLEVERLITGKVLVQAMSGGGKSYAVRRILEQTYGAAQHIVFDPEGEYHTLREICDYVLVGPGGEGPATLETAAKMATRLLELGVSAIIDISELGTNRAEYIKRFLTSVMDAPRALWHPLLLAIDEAQKFCLDEETEILTRDGWMRHSSIVRMETEAVAFDLRNGTYRYELISDVIRKHYAGDLVVLRSNRVDCRVTPEHRVVLRREQRAMNRVRRLYDWAFCEARSVPQQVKLPTGGAPYGNGVPLSDDMLRLIGWVVTDGCFTGGNRQRYLSISQSHATRKRGVAIVAEMDAVLERLGGRSRYERPMRANSKKSTAPSVDYYLGKELSSDVMAWTGVEIHRVPRRLIVDATRAQLEWLMQGLLEGDGTAGSGSKWLTFYAGHNEGLADDFQEIALRLGISPTKKLVPQTGQWIVMLAYRPHHHIHKPTTQPYDGTVWCVTVPSGAFVVRRGGKVFVTGNCPEKGAGEAASTEAIKDYATRGRKRGYSLICATQRIAELHKTVIAECQHKLIGRTSLDVDIDRARRPLGMSARDADDVLPHLDAGCFYVSGFGAKGKARQIQIGEVATTHPRAGMGSVPVTPPRSKIKAILAKFADIPKEAEIEAKTVDELRAKIRSLEAAAVSPNTMTPPVSVKEYRSLDERANALERRVIETEKERDEARSMERVLSDVNEDLVKQIDAAIDVISQMPGVDEMKRTVEAIGQLSKLANALHDVRNASLDAFTKEVEERDRLPPKKAVISWTDTSPMLVVTDVERAFVNNSNMPAMQRAMLVVLAQRGGKSPTNTPIPKAKILIWSGYSRGGATSKAFADLVKNGWVTQDGRGLWITAAGMHALGSYEELPRGRALRERIRGDLAEMERKMFDALCSAYPHAITKSDLLDNTGYARGGATSKAFAYLVARDYCIADGPGRLRAAKELFE